MVRLADLWLVVVVTVGLTRASLLSADDGLSLDDASVVAAGESSALVAANGVEMYDHILKGSDGSDLMDALYKKSNVKIIFTDAGIGGMDIMSQFIELYQKQPVFQNATLIYMDLWRSFRGKPFSLELQRIHKMEPDILFIACNGMSFKYIKGEGTPFTKDPKFPVILMPPLGTSLWGKALEDYEDHPMILMVSPTTGKSYLPLLAERLGSDKWDKVKVIVQVCHPVITTVQTFGPEDDRTKAHTMKCAENAWKQVKDRGLDSSESISVGLGCTHFGWMAQSWIEGFKKASGTDVKVNIFDPNKEMASFMFKGPHAGARTKAANPHSSVQVEAFKKHAKGVKNVVSEPLKRAIEKGVSEPPNHR